MFYYIRCVCFFRYIIRHNQPIADPKLGNIATIKNTTRPLNLANQTFEAKQLFQKSSNGSKFLKNSLKCPSEFIRIVCIETLSIGALAKHT